jgi:rubredoxin
VPDPGGQVGEELDATQPMCAKHWWATLGPDSTCPVCAAQSGKLVAVV